MAEDSIFSRVLEYVKSKMSSSTAQGEQENYGMPAHWHPVDVTPIQPGHPNGAPPSLRPLQNYYTGSLAPQLQHDSHFTETGYQTNSPITPLMPVAPSGLATSNAASSNTAVQAVSKALPGTVSKGTVSQATLDSVANSATSAKVSITAVNENVTKGVVGALAPAQPGFLSQGSTPFAIQATPFSYTATTTTVTISWTGVQILRGDGTILPLPDGLILVSGLTANSTYYAYPYLNDLALPGAIDYQVVSFLTGLATSVGSPLIFYPNQLAVLGQAQSLQHRISLNSGAITVVTPSSGSTGGSSGGTGGSGGGSGNKYTD